MLSVSAQSLRTARNLPDAFIRACRLHADRTAIWERGSTVTYRELGDRVGELTVGLTATLPEDFQTGNVQEPLLAPSGAIAVEATPSVDGVCGLLSVLMIGAAYVPLDPTSPDVSLAQVYRTAQPRVVLGSSDFTKHIPGMACLDLTTVAQAGYSIQTQTTNNAGRIRAAGASDPALVALGDDFTDGPKNVVLSHRALLHSAAARLYAYGVPGRVPLLHSALDDTYSSVLWWTLLTGGTLVIAQHPLLDVSETAALITDNAITDLVFPAWLYPRLLDRFDPAWLRSLRRVILAREYATTGMVDQHLGCLRHVDLHIEYGRSEAIAPTSQRCVWNAQTQQRDTLGIGQPVSGTAYRLTPVNTSAVEHIDDNPPPPNDHNDAVGDLGELCITGPQLASGYAGHPVLTAQRFVRLPDGQRAFRTGHLARVTPLGDVVLYEQVERRVMTPEPGRNPSVARTGHGPQRVKTRHEASVALTTARRPGGTETVLTASQAQFFTQNFADPHHVTQMRLWTLPAWLTTEDVRRLVTVVLGAHEPFRTVFRRGPKGWTGCLLDGLPHGELAEYTVNSPNGLVSTQHGWAHQGLDLTHGPLWRAATFVDFVRRRRWLRVVAHHLLVDNRSWDILTSDFALALQDPEQLPACAPALTIDRHQLTTSEVMYWESFAAQQMPLLGNIQASRSSYGQWTHIDGAQSPRATSKLLDLIADRGVGVLDVLLAVLHQTLTPVTSGDGLYVLLEGNGRHRVDVENIVGPMDVLVPVLLTTARDNSTLTRPPADLLVVAQQFRRQLEAIPGCGVGFGIARDLTRHAPLGALLAEVPMPELVVSFVDRRAARHDGMHAVLDQAEQAVGATNVLPYAIHVQAEIADVLRVRVCGDPARISYEIQKAAAAAVLTSLDSLAGETANGAKLTIRPTSTN